MQDAEKKVDKFTEGLRELMMAVVEQCAQAVEEMPASASLYENGRIAEAVIDFKKRAAALAVLTSGGLLDKLDGGGVRSIALAGPGSGRITHRQGLG